MSENVKMFSASLSLGNSTPTVKEGTEGENKRKKATELCSARLKISTAHPFRMKAVAAVPNLQLFILICYDFQIWHCL